MRKAIELSVRIEKRIRPWEHIALLGVRAGFLRGTLSLNMRETGFCLGSHVALFGKRDPFVYMGLVYSHALRELYFPGIKPSGEIDFKNPGWNADSFQAARAIERFLADEGHLLWVGD